MAASVLFSSAVTAVSVAAGATRSMNMYQGRLVAQATEANATSIFRTTGTLSNIMAVISSNAAAGSGTFKTRVGTSNGSQTVTVGAGVTGKIEDTTHSDTVAAGDDWHYQYVGGTGGATTIRAMSVVFSPNSDTVSRLHGGGGASASLAAASTTNFICCGGNGEDNATEANTQVKLKAGGTVQNLFVYISSNARSTATTFGNRKNGSNGSLSVSVGSSATGTFEDTSHTDSVAVDDLVNCFITTGTGTGTIAWETVGFELLNTSGASVWVAHTVAGEGYAPGDTYYLTPSGVLGTQGSGGSEPTDTALEVNVAGTWSQLEMYVSANTLVALSATVKSRVNAADGAMSVTIGTGVTGWVGDATNSDTLAATDDIDAAITIGVGSGTLTVRTMASVFTVAAAAGQPTIRRHGETRRGGIWSSGKPGLRHFAPQMSLREAA